MAVFARAGLASLFLCAALAAAPARAADVPGEAEPDGDAAAAGRYADWAEDAIGRGEWRAALTALERAADYGDVSSDLSLLLARARDHEGEPCGAVLDALRRALAADRWKKGSAAEARLLEAETLVRLRNYDGALRVLARNPGGERETELALLALKGLPGSGAFREAVGEALDRYPRNVRVVRVFFEYAARGMPAPGDEALMAAVLRRLPLLLEEDPELAFLAAPFVRDAADAGRLTASYRALFTPPSLPSPASIPAALNAGLIGDFAATDELFAAEGDLDKDLLLSVFGLLRSEEGRDYFNRNLRAFSGVIVEDSDSDGFYESRTRYLEGEIQNYRHDADQDRLPEFTAVFSGGDPVRAEQVVLPEPDKLVQAGRGALPLRDGERIKARIEWEKYPAVLSAELEGCAYIPRPLDFFFSPFRLVELCGSGKGGALLYPEYEEEYPRLSRRSLVSFSIQIRRPSAEFRGADERVDLDRGVPRRAVETLDGRVVSVTEFERGRPLLQRADLDLDGRMETVRRFRRPAPRVPGEAEDLLEWKKELVFAESDWNGDGRYETAEEYLPGGERRYYGDMDGDGIRDYSGTITEE
ncbi:MAG: hypothetical protein LBL44_03275 [Treponema sp.]|jgi:hypothetical protein|nr:hypothetical protein [Treponema sp.]